MLTTFLWIYLLYLFIYSNIAKGSTRGERRGKVQISAIWNKGIIRNLTNKIIKFERPKKWRRKKTLLHFQRSFISVYPQITELPIKSPVKWTPLFNINNGDAFLCRLIFSRFAFVFFPFVMLNPVCATISP